MTTDRSVDLPRAGGSRAAFGFMVVVTVLACLGVGLPLGAGLSLRVIDVLALCAAGLAVTRLVLRADLEVALAVLVGVAVAAFTLLSASPLVFAVRLALIPVVAWFVYACTARARMALLWGAVVAGAVNGLLALAEARLGNDYFAVQEFQIRLAQLIPRDRPELVPVDAGLIRISAQYPTPNELGGILVLLVFAGFLLRCVSRHRRVVTLLVGLAAAGLYVTGSRASYLAVFGMLAIVVGRSVRSSTRPLAAKLVVAGLAAVTVFLAVGGSVGVSVSGSPSFISRITTAFTVGSEATTPLRIQTWREAVAAIADNPLFGVGLDRVYDVVPATHNSFLFIYLSTGLMGLVVFAIWWLVLVWVGLRLVFRNTAADVVSGGALLMLSALFFVEDRPGSPVFMALAAALFGLALSRSAAPYDESPAGKALVHAGRRT